ncbi:MAG: hypothetical protein ACE5Q6_20315 [Dehalococcoidia bacterium]
MTIYRWLWGQRRPSALYLLRLWALYRLKVEHHIDLNSVLWIDWNAEENQIIYKDMVPPEKRAWVRWQLQRGFFIAEDISTLKTSQQHRTPVSG